MKDGKKIKMRPNKIRSNAGLAFIGLCLAAIGLPECAKADADMSTPPFSMIQRVCRTLPDGFPMQIETVKAAIQPRKDQAAAWNDFVGKLGVAQKPVMDLCRSKIDGLRAPSIFGTKPDDKRAAQQASQDFMQVMDVMGREMDVALEDLKGSLGPEQIESLDQAMKSR
jgi:hypothetical protein